MENTDSVMFIIAKILTALFVVKAMIIGTDFSFYYLFKYKSKYWTWYKNREIFSDYIKKHTVTREEPSTKITKVVNLP